MKQERIRNGRCNRVARLEKPDGLSEARDFSHEFFTEALLTVLTSGTISDNGFQMPATACCCENFAVVRKQMKRHSLSLLVCDPLDKRADEDGYFTMPVFGQVFIEK